MIPAFWRSPGSSLCRLCVDVAFRLVGANELFGEARTTEAGRTEARRTASGQRSGRTTAGGMGGNRRDDAFHADAAGGSAAAGQSAAEQSATDQCWNGHGGPSCGAGSECDLAAVHAARSAGLSASSAAVSEPNCPVSLHTRGCATSHKFTAPAGSAEKRKDLPEPGRRGHAGAREQLRYRDCALQLGRFRYGYPAFEGWRHAAWFAVRLGHRYSRNLQYDTFLRRWSRWYFGGSFRRRCRFQRPGALNQRRRTGAHYFGSNARWNGAVGTCEYATAEPYSLPARIL